MKLRDGVIMNEMDGQCMVVDTGNGKERFNGIIKLNSSGAFVAKMLQSDTTLEKIVKAMTDYYDVTEEVAKVNAQRIIDGFQSVGLLE